MKRTYLSLLVAGFTILQFGVGRVYAEDRTHEIGVQAYVYAYPMILMEVTRRVCWKPSAATAYSTCGIS